MVVGKLYIFFIIHVMMGTDRHHDFEFRFDYTYNEDAGGWLKLHKVPATWSNARFQCHAEGAVLASPLTDHLRHAMLHLASEVMPSSTIYTGIHATYAKSVFTSVEGVPLTMIPITWSPQAPYNYNYADSDSCLVMLVITKHSGTVSDTKCSDANPYICYKKKTHLSAINECGTVDEEYKLYAKTGKCYKFHRFGLTWTGAFKTCVAEGGNLAVINSKEEFQILKDIHSNYPNNKIFSRHTDIVALGFSDPNDGTNWITIEGQTLKEAGFEQWDNGEPNNASQPLGEMCGFIKRDNGKFNDAPCNWPVPFICEKDPHRSKNI